MTSTTVARAVTKMVRSYFPKENFPVAEKQPDGDGAENANGGQHYTPIRPAIYWSELEAQIILGIKTGVVGCAFLSNPLSPHSIASITHTSSSNHPLPCQNMSSTTVTRAVTKVVRSYFPKSEKSFPIVDKAEVLDIEDSAWI
ncbi:hypothetical protein M422DRAFT_244074 [Sphaerobolus stellatus SS14]|nr:hypothetical protein M422DRAFT_244074 [Sphaerobolus stellatus SS14]